MWSLRGQYGRHEAARGCTLVAATLCSSSKYLVALLHGGHTLVGLVLTRVKLLGSDLQHSLRLQGIHAMHVLGFIFIFG